MIPGTIWLFAERRVTDETKRYSDMRRPMQFLGIETSCDETAAAVVADGRTVRSSVVSSQIDQHRPFGGVVPEIASRAHVDLLPDVVEAALLQAGLSWDGLDGIAVTYGPGLASSLQIGLRAAQALALRLGKPLHGVNHLAGHCYSILLDPAVASPESVLPLIVLLVTGGHTMLVRVDAWGTYRLLGQTLDDAVGEALDKGATLMGLGYPGGPEIEKAARGGDPARHDFPRGLRGGGAGWYGALPRACCFSFSGLKTALRYMCQQHPEYAAEPERKHLAASYQEAAFDALLDRLERALAQEAVPQFACVGGVARNERLRAKLDALATRCGVRWYTVPPAYCTDNAAMIAGLAGHLAGQGVQNPLPDDVQPNLPLCRT